MIIWPRVARFAVGIACVIKRDLGPVAGIVAAGTLARPVAAWRCMTGRTVIQIGMVHRDFLPVVGIVAL